VLVELLDRVWPSWPEQHAALLARGLPPTPEGWKQLVDGRRAEGLGPLPERVNRRTAAALLASHSKVPLTGLRRTALGAADATGDGVVRLRPPACLVAVTQRGRVDLGEIGRVLGEVSIAERAFLDGLAFEGDLRALLLVENLGAWRDLSAPDGWLVAHVPGWNTAVAEHLLRRVAVQVVHFGDLDPAGVRIHLHLRSIRPDLRWFVPGFWAEQLAARALPADWPADLDVSVAPPLVRELAARGLWLEQEPIVLDPRLPAELQRVLAGGLT
jgi:hypothetical protein